MWYIQIFKKNGMNNSSNESKNIFVKNILPIILLSLYLYFLQQSLNNDKALLSIRDFQNSTLKYAFATVTTPAFAMGAVTLGNTLKKYHGDKYSRVCLVSEDVNDSWISVLEQWWDVRKVPEFKPSRHSRRSWIKLRLWSLKEFKKIIYLDTDVLLFSKIDELFEYPQLSCVPDVNPPQICNSGVFVLEPNPKTYSDIISFSKKSKNRYGIGDQGTINAFFGSFTPIPARYNLPRVETRSFKRLNQDHSFAAVHYVCKKPWKCGRNGVRFCGCGFFEYNDVWWREWDLACSNHKCLESWWEPLTGQGF